MRTRKPQRDTRFLRQPNRRLSQTIFPMLHANVHPRATACGRPAFCCTRLRAGQVAAAAWQSHRSTLCVQARNQLLTTRRERTAIRGGHVAARRRAHAKTSRARCRSEAQARRADQSQSETQSRVRRRHRSFAYGIRGRVLAVPCGRPAIGYVSTPHRVRFTRWEHGPRPLPRAQPGYPSQAAEALHVMLAQADAVAATASVKSLPLLPVQPTRHPTAS